MSVDVGSVAAVLVPNDPSVALPLDGSVSGGHIEVVVRIQLERGVGMTADSDVILGKDLDNPGPAAGNDPELCFHVAGPTITLPRTSPPP